MSADDSISSITVDTPIAMIAVCDWPLSIFVSVVDVNVFTGMTDEFIVVKSKVVMICKNRQVVILIKYLKLLLYSPLCISVISNLVTVSDVACVLEVELLAMAVVEVVVTSAVLWYNNNEHYFVMVKMTTIRFCKQLKNSTSLTAK